MDEIFDRQSLQSNDGPRGASPRADRAEAVNDLMCSSGSLWPEFYGKPDENSFGPPDVAEPVGVLMSPGV